MTPRTLLSLAATALLAAGCGAGTIERMPGETANPIRLDTVTTERRVGDDAPDMARVATAANEFLASQGFGHGDILTVRGGARSEREGLARALAAPGRTVRAAPGEDDGRGLRLVLMRTVATPPTCGDWSDPPTQDFSNLPPGNFGCANQSNLARMVADPNDLAGGRSAARFDSERMTVLIDAYRRDAIVITYGAAESVTSGD